MQEGFFNRWTAHFDHITIPSTLRLKSSTYSNCAFFASALRPLALLILATTSAAVSVGEGAAAAADSRAAAATTAERPRPP